MWVDPTSEHQRVGTIPSSDSGRLALVANKETEALQRIPQASSRDNGEKEHRVFHLANEGEAVLTVTSEPWGAYEAEYRSWKLDYNIEDLREYLESWVKEQFLADKLDEIEFSDPADLDESFTIRLTMDQARRGYTAFDDAIVAIRYEGLLDGFPEIMLEEGDEERQGDFIYRRPFQTIWHYRAVPASGFVAGDLPDDRITELGSARLEEVFTLADDGSIEALITLDSGPRRITAELFESTREALIAQGLLKVR